MDLEFGVNEKHNVSMITHNYISSYFYDVLQWNIHD